MFKWFGSLLLFISLTSHAQAGEVEGLADQVLLQSGTYEMISSLPEQIRAHGSQQSPFETDRETSEKVINILASSFNEAEVKSDLLEYMVANYSSEDLKGILEWLHSPLGNRISTAEIEAGSVEGQSNMMRYSATFSSNPPPQERVLLIQEFEKKLRLTKLTMDMIKTMMYGISKSFYTASPEAERVSEQEFNAEVESMFLAMEPMLREQMWQQVILTSHYSYRDFSDAELNSYINYLDSEPGKKYVQVGEGLLKVITDVFTKAFSELIEDI